jgi:hypothetical protein
MRVPRPAACLLCTLALCGLIVASCGPAAAPPTPAPAPVADGAKDHAGDAHEESASKKPAADEHADHDHGELPKTLTEAVAAFEGHWKTITAPLAKDAKAFAEAEQKAVDSAVHEAGHVLEAVEGFAEKAEGAASETLRKAQAELFECLDSVDQKLHGDAIDGEEIRKAIAAIEARVVAAVASLKGLLPGKEPPADAKAPASEKAAEKAPASEEAPVAETEKNAPAEQAKPAEQTSKEAA